MKHLERSRPLRIDEALSWGVKRLSASGVDGAALDAGLLLGHSLGLTREQLFTRGRDRIGEAGLRRYRLFIDRRSRRVPLAHITGRREFWSLPIGVDGRVLVPRPETEGVVEAALEFLAGPCLALDVGTGSGNITAALATELPEGRFVALDISGEALDLAARNLRDLGLGERVLLLQGDLLAPLGRTAAFDAVLSNPPYVPSGEIAALQPEVRECEPKVALDGGPDGLLVIRRLLEEAPSRLRRGGRLVIEVGAGQGEAAAGLVRGSGRFGKVEVRRDLAGRGRVIVAERV